MDSFIDVLHTFTMLKPIMHGFKFHIRVEDLAAADVLEVVCGGCEHRYMIATYQLHERFPSSSRLIDIEKRFRCRKCGRQGGARWSIYRAVPPVQEI